MKALSVCVCTASVRKRIAKKLPGELPIRSPRQSLLLPLPLPLLLLLLQLLLLLLASARSSSVTRGSIHLGKKEAPTHPPTHPYASIHWLIEVRPARRRSRLMRPFCAPRAGGGAAVFSRRPPARRRGGAAGRARTDAHGTPQPPHVASQRGERRGKGGAKGTRGRSGAP